MRCHVLLAHRVRGLASRSQPTTPPPRATGSLYLPALGNKSPDSGYVVVGALGDPPHPDTFYDKWAKALKDAGVEHRRLHDARHSCATLMTLSGVPPTIIAEWLGHVDPKFTMSVYSHPTKDGLSEAGRTLSNVFKRGAGEEKQETTGS